VKKDEMILGQARLFLLLKVLRGLIELFILDAVFG
jgi:hypothetical protein